jgi:hypothetical protein
MSLAAQAPSLNFSFLAEEDQQLVRFGGLAERYFKDDPNTCLVKLRQYGETLAQLAAAHFGLYYDPHEPQLGLLRRLSVEGRIPREVADTLRHLRTIGNTASHSSEGTHADALKALKVARELGVWYHRTFGTMEDFSPGPFIPPPDPAAATQQLRDELTRLRAVVDSQKATPKLLASSPTNTYWPDSAPKNWRLKRSKTVLLGSASQSKLSRGSKKLRRNFSGFRSKLGRQLYSRNSIWLLARNLSPGRLTWRRRNPLSRPPERQLSFRAPSKTTSSTTMSRKWVTTWVTLGRSRY